MIGFESPYPTAISQVSRTGWRLLAHLVWHGIDRDGQPERIEIPEGDDTDFASTPASLWSEFPPYGDYTAAVIAHDDFWRRRVPAGLMTYRDADRHLRIMLAAAGVSWLRRWTMFAAVRWGSLLTRRGGYKQWWRDAPAVLGMTAIAVPFVAVPFVVNTVFRALFAALEWLISAVFPSSKGAPAPSTEETQ